MSFKHLMHHFLFHFIRCVLFRVRNDNFFDIVLNSKSRFALNILSPIEVHEVNESQLKIVFFFHAFQKMKVNKINVANIFCEHFRNVHEVEIEV